MSKAFDTVNHQKLSIKLEHSGVRRKSYLKSYIDNRKQTVEISAVQSTDLTMLTGLPQGSILSLLLFIKYIDELLTQLSENSDISFVNDEVVLILGRKNSKEYE